MKLSALKNDYVFLLCCTSFNLAVHFIKFLIGKRILIDKVANNEKKNGGNDCREYQNGVLCDLRIVGQFRIVSV